MHFELKTKWVLMVLIEDSVAQFPNQKINL